MESSKYQIEVKNLCKDFTRRIPGKGLRRVFPKKKAVHALSNMNLALKKGEFIGYIGPNGSGKSTTIKCMTGVLVPTSGEVRCLGYVPWEQRQEYTQHIGVVFGQKSLLWWDLKVLDSLKLYKDIYEVPQEQFDSRLERFNEILRTGPLLHRRVRRLSLGERMRCELVAALLHKPKLLFLDEPTIGLDVVAKEEVRSFLQDINRDEGTTIVLTTHDITDIEALCKRVVLVDNGKKIYDGELSALKKKYITEKEVRMFCGGIKDRQKLSRTLKKCTVNEKAAGYISLNVNIKKHAVSDIVEDLMTSCKVIDLSVHEPELTRIIAEIYRKGRV